MPDGTVLLQTVDFFTPVVDDPFDWGRIAAANALSDIYAMGGRPMTALQLIAWPRDGLSFDVLEATVAGGVGVLQQAGCTLVGGHSIDDQEPKYGFAITGVVDESNLVRNQGAEPGDALVLTKPIGTGLIATAIKEGTSPASVAEAATEVMATLNDGASKAMTRVGVHAATDVTGFGLLGHLSEMLIASDVGAELDPTAVPLIDGVRALAEAGSFPGGSVRNLQAVRPTVVGEIDEPTLRILADAQTSGGLLIAVAQDRLGVLLEALNEEGTLAAAVIGEVIADDCASIVLT